nr:MAG TPA: hypothetical protein [Caudoviricetes sp.]
MLLRLSIPFLCAVLKIGLQYSCQKKYCKTYAKMLYYHRDSI